MGKSIKSYNLSKNVIKVIHDRAKEDLRSDSDWLDVFLTKHFKTKEIKEIKPKVKRFQPPTQQDIDAFANENNLTATGFFDYYESNGWKVGKNSMKDWKAALRRWSKNQSQYSSNQQNFDDDSTDWVNQDHGIII